MENDFNKTKKAVIVIWMVIVGFLVVVIVGNLIMHMAGY